jgi:hypothetical protein
MLAVHKTPMSGKPDELRDFGGISATEIVSAVKHLHRHRGPTPLQKTTHGV